MQSTQPGVIDYQLYLLRAMPDAPSEMVDRALDTLGANRVVMEEAFRHISDLKMIADPETGQVNRVFETVTSLLGRPISQTTRKVHGQACEVRTFVLPLWNEFFFEVSGDAHGVIWDEHFTRRPETPIPDLVEPGSLEPWRITVQEVEDRHGPFEQIELWPPYAAYAMNHLDTDGISHRYEMTFSWGLLQSIRPVEA